MRNIARVDTKVLSQKVLVAEPRIRVRSLGQFLVKKVFTTFLEIDYTINT